MDANDLLMGGGIKSASFPDQQFGATVAGVIVRPPAVRQQTDFDSGEPKFFPNGDPMQQIVVQVQTDLRDPADPADDGVRAFYLKAQMMQAVRDAVKATGAKGLDVGGHLTITYVRDEPNSRGRGKAKKVYAAVYRPPAVQAANDALMGTAQPNDGAWVPSGLPGVTVPPPVQQQPAAPVAPASTPPPPAPPGVDPAMWARMEPAQQQAVLAAMGQTPPF